MREFSRFYDKQEPVVSRLRLVVNNMLNVSIVSAGILFKSRILRRHHCIPHLEKVEFVLLDKFSIFKK